MARLQVIRVEDIHVKIMFANTMCVHITVYRGIVRQVETVLVKLCLNMLRMSSALRLFDYEGCSNINTSSFIIFVTYMLRQNGIRFDKGLYITFKLASCLKKNTVYLSRYSPLNECYSSLLTTQLFESITVI